MSEKKFDLDLNRDFLGVKKTGTKEMTWGVVCINDSATCNVVANYDMENDPIFQYFMKLWEEDCGQ